MAKKIKTEITCENIAPITRLERSFTSESLKIGILASNGSGKTYLSRLFRLLEKQSGEDSTSENFTDSYLTFGTSKGSLKFKISEVEGDVKEDLSIDISKGSKPIIPTSKYLYHTFNQDYVEDNIRALGYEKNSEVEGFILGKVNIDLKEDEEAFKELQDKESNICVEIDDKIGKVLEAKLNQIKDIKRLQDYRDISFDNIVRSEGKTKYNIGKSFQDLLEDFNKIKSVPEQLSDVASISELNLNFTLLAEIDQYLQEEYSLSSLAEDFKAKVREKQDFIESGMDLLLYNESNCPFCEQEMSSVAKSLIDEYTKFLTDTESKVHRELASFLGEIEKAQKAVEVIYHSANQAIANFDSYKTKYLASCSEMELDILEVENILTKLGLVADKIQEKKSNIGIKVEGVDSIIKELQDLQSSGNKCISENNVLISTLNSKKNRINEESKTIRKQLCNRVYDDLISSEEKKIQELADTRKEIMALNSDISKKRELQKVSKRTEVAATVKTVLNYFFADKYSLDEDSFRLKFKTNLLEKDQAKHVLSEGEKNIVAFAFYLGDTHLKVEKEDDYKNIFFIIDDPISSMDFTHVYTMSGVIRNLREILPKIGRERFIIFTHNNDFMRVLAQNKIIGKKLLLKKGELKDFNLNFTVPYINHLEDVYKIARKGDVVTHTTANSIRHIIETLTKFQNVSLSSDSIAEFIKDKFPDDNKSFTLIQDLSHGGWRSEQPPIEDEDYVDVCEAIIKHIETDFPGQIKYCETC